MKPFNPEHKERIQERHKQVREEAIRSRKFDQEVLTKQAVEFLLFGLKIEKNRDKIIKTAKRVRS